MRVILVRDENEFNKLLKTEDNLIIDFYANWCGPCKVLSKTFADLASEDLDFDVTVAKLNVDDHPAIARSYNVKSLPTMVFTKNNESDRSVEKTKVGLLQKQDLKNLIGEIYE